MRFFIIQEEVIHLDINKFIRFAFGVVILLLGDLMIEDSLQIFMDCHTIIGIKLVKLGQINAGKNTGIGLNKT